MIKIILLLSLCVLNLQNSCNQETKKTSSEVPILSDNNVSVEVVQNSPTKAIEVENQQKDLPVNWPWRGVSVESKKTKPEDLIYLKSIHVNFVRIFIKGDKRAKREKINPTLAFNKELNWADSILDFAKSQGITCMIAFNNLNLDPNSEIDDKHPDFWQNKSLVDSAINLVDIIVKRYQNRGIELTAYEVIGEPAVESLGRMKTPDNIEDFYKRILTTIRKYDTQRYFLLTPGPWGKPNNYNKFNGYDIKDKKLIYGVHMYLPDPFTHQGVKKRPRGLKYPGFIDQVYWDKKVLREKFAKLKAFEAKTGNLIFVGEFQSIKWSDGGNIWLKDVVDIIDENKWAWAMYGFQCDTDFWDPYYDVVNKKGDSKEWKIEYVGKETEGWKMMVDYFKLNKK